MRRSTLLWALTGLCAVLIALAGVLVVAVLALEGEKSANSHASAVANCVNTDLATRNAPSSKDSAAHIAFAKAVEGLFLPADATPAQRAAELELFERQIQAYVVTLVADQKTRAATPLGKC